MSKEYVYKGLQNFADGACGEQSPTEIDEILEWQESKGFEVLGNVYESIKESLDVE